jgi:hypothetical protein
MIRTGIRHISNRNRVNTAGRRLTSRALSGLNDRMQSRVLEIRRSSSGARPVGIPTLTKMAAKRSMSGRMSSTGAVGATGHRCRR